MGKGQQYLTALTCAFGFLMSGIIYSWPSYTLSLYKSENTTILSSPMSEVEVSLVGSLPSLGAMVGSGATGLLINKFGRKNGGIILSLPYLLSWCIVEISSSSMIILIARFIGGIPCGAFLVYSPIFISEIAEDSVRGTLASGTIVGYCFGVLVSYLMGWFMSYQAIIIIGTVLSIILLILIFLVTESPIYLLKQNREQDALEALARYRGATASSKLVVAELSRMKQQVSPAVELVAVSEEKADEAEKQKLNNDKIENDNDANMSAIKILFTSAAPRRAFIVVMITVSSQVFMGLVPIQVYANDIFLQAVPNMSSNLCSVLFAAIMLVGCLVASLVSDKAGRRILILASCILVLICMVSLGFLMQSRTGPAWMTAVSLLLYCFSFTLGAGTVPYILLAEVFVSEVQSIASMLIIEWVLFLNFVIIGIFPFVQMLIGFHGACYSFAAVAALNGVYSFLAVPETKGLSTDQIQEVLRSGRRK